jgi:hypothetical protein
LAGLSRMVSKQASSLLENHLASHRRREKVSLLIEIVDSHLLIQQQPSHSQGSSTKDISACELDYSVRLLLLGRATSYHRRILSK